MGIVVICEDMKWTYQQYLEQPEWFIELLLLKKKVEAINSQINEKKQRGTSNP